MKKIEGLTIILLIILLLGLSSCAKPKVADQTKQPTLTDTIANMGKAGKAIGCVFAPWHDECKRLKDEKVPHPSQEEYLEQINEEFNELDKDAESNHAK